jgi:hypothetical protein
MNIAPGGPSENSSMMSKFIHLVIKEKEYK